MWPRTQFVLVGTLLAAGVVLAVWLVWFQPRGYTAPDAEAGNMAFGDTMVQYVSSRGGLLVVVWADFSGS
jgi:hypothetical protein